MANASNFSFHAFPGNELISVWYWWLCGVIAVITVLGNLLVILLILTRSLLRTTQNWFVLSLAVADLLIGLFIFPLRFVFQFLYKTDRTLFLLKAYDFLIFASMTNLCAMTLDRYLYILHPLRHNILERNGNVWKILALAWFVSFLFPLINLLIDLFIKDFEDKRVPIFFLMFGFKAVLCMLLTIAYGRILHFSKRQEKQIKKQSKQVQHNYPENSEPKRARKNTKMIRVLGGVIGFFVISCLANIWDAYLAYFPTFRFNIQYHRAAMSLVYANSAVNVFIYGLFKRDFRREITKVFCSRRAATNAISPQLELN